MEEKKLSKYEELSKLMENINLAMDMEKTKQQTIDKEKASLYEETRPMMVEKRKKDIDNLTTDKKEFDEMTIRSLRDAKKEILEIRQESDKKYQELLIETVNKQKRIEGKIASMRTKGLSPEKLEIAERSAQKAREAVNTEMKKFQAQYFEQSKKLSEFENKISDHAKVLEVWDLVMVNNINNSKNKNKTEEPKTEEPKVEEPKAEEPKTEEPKVEEPKTEEPKAEEPKTEEPKVEEPKAEEPKVEEPKAEEPKTEEPKAGDKKLISIVVDGKEYTFKYLEQKKDEYYPSKDVSKKMNFFKGLAEKGKLFIHRREYGIDFKTVIKSDPNILKKLSNSERETYLNFMAGEENACGFDIEYKNKKGMYARIYTKALNSAQDRLKAIAEKGMKNGKSEGVGKTPEELHKEKEEKYNKMFGDGFYQAENGKEEKLDSAVAEAANEISETVKKMTEEWGKNQENDR